MAPSQHRKMVNCTLYEFHISKNGERGGRGRGGMAGGVRKAGGRRLVMPDVGFLGLKDGVTFVSLK